MFRKSPIARIKKGFFMRSLFVSAVFAFSLASMACAQSAPTASIGIEGAWARVTPEGAKVGAGYVTLKNTGTLSDRLVSATAPELAGRVEIHEMAETNGIMTMRAVTGLEIGAGKSVALKPGGFHIMFLDLKKPLKLGDSVQGTLTFERAGTVAVTYTVDNKLKMGY
jgi:periplasmic copper chaperone A